jgi:four helix bundle protein
MNDHPNVAAWGNARKLAVAVYKQTAGFPLMEQAGLADQMRRAIITAATSLAEAQSRSSRRERLEFLQTARGAMYQLQTQALISGDLGFLPQQHADAMVKASVAIGRQVTKLIRACRTTQTT